MEVEVITEEEEVGGIFKGLEEPLKQWISEEVEVDEVNLPFLKNRKGKI